PFDDAKVSIIPSPAKQFVTLFAQTACFIDINQTKKLLNYNLTTGIGAIIKEKMEFSERFLVPLHAS
uniref:hypothetical protein n=1 Tax=Segatella buccae TaxID=28126 RepID=UPI0028EBF13C